MSDSEYDRMESEIPLQEILAASLNDLYAGVIVVNAFGKIEFANNALCELFALSRRAESLRGMTSSDALKELIETYRDPEKGLARVREIVAQGQPVRGEEVPIKGDRTFLRDFIPLSFQGRSVGRVWHHTDITLLKQAEERIFKLLEEKEALLGDLVRKNKLLADLASTDILTGLANRNRFDDCLCDEMKRSSRYGVPLSFILLDIDHFKNVNDSFGHQAGDEALCSTARVIKRIIREPDSAFRWGGEEFAVLAPHTH